MKGDNVDFWRDWGRKLGVGKVNLINEVKTIGNRYGYLVLTYPWYYAQTLIQLGYEPYALPGSRRGSRWFRRSYPDPCDIFEYLGYIKNVDGFVGCYRGLGARLCQTIVADTVHKRMSAKCPWPEQQPHPPRSGAWFLDALEDLGEDLEFSTKKAGWDIVCATASALASQPFYVVAVRTMGQFVGRETAYKTLMQSIRYIYDNEGISGFFSGLIPRLTGDILFIGISSYVGYLASSYFGKQNGSAAVATVASKFLARSISYEYEAIASEMAVNNVLWFDIRSRYALVGLRL